MFEPELNSCTYIVGDVSVSDPAKRPPNIFVYFWIQHPHPTPDPLKLYQLQRFGMNCLKKKCHECVYIVFFLICIYNPNLILLLSKMYFAPDSHILCWCSALLCIVWQEPKPKSIVVFIAF